MPKQVLDALFLSAAKEQYKRYDIEYINEENKIRNLLERTKDDHSSMPDNYWKNRHRLYNLRRACEMIINALEPNEPDGDDTTKINQNTA